MDLALRQSPVNLCSLRKEPYVVIGNAGVARVLAVGSSVKDLATGDHCILFCNGEEDAAGFPITIYGYDAPGTTGFLSKQVTLHPRQLVKIPDSSDEQLRQWSAFSLRYITAWSNWRVAYQCWLSQMNENEIPSAHVFAWGGGVSMAELTLAQHFGFARTTIITSMANRNHLLRDHGIECMDRSLYAKNVFETEFVKDVLKRTDDKGVAIFIDNVGAHHRATVKCLARQGVLTTSGWKASVSNPLTRSSECIQRHIHVFTHYARYEEGVAAVAFASQTGWLPPIGGKLYEWEEIPQLAEDYSNQLIHSYFPLYRVNP